MRENSSKKWKKSPYACFGLIAFLAVMSVLVILRLRNNLAQDVATASIVGDIVVPFVIGLTFAYLLAPFFDYVKESTYPLFAKKLSRSHSFSKAACKTVAMLASILLVFVVFGGMISIMVPYIQKSNAVSDTDTTLPDSIGNYTPNEDRKNVIPFYWQDAIEEAEEKVRTIQDRGGNTIVNFMWFSDYHYGGDAGYVGNIGPICRRIMDDCGIPLALMTGDTLTAGILPTEDQVVTALEGAMDLLSPIGEDLMLIRGNHDDVYGSYTNDANETTCYVNKVAPAKMWNALHRPQAEDSRRVFGGDGTYFYLDHNPQKIRFICLNSHFYDGEAITDGTVRNMTIEFGAEQLDWLENVALDIEKGWSVVISTHVPPAGEYINQYRDGEAFKKIVNANEKDIIAVFSGHAHKDLIFEEELAVPVVTVICSTNTPYDGTEAERVAGTDHETALDIVSIDTKNRKIYMTRLGAGEDREVSY